MNKKSILAAFRRMWEHVETLVKSRTTWQYF